VRMTIPLWPSRAPAHGSVHLREVGPEDVAMARELSTDPYVPQTGSLPFTASNDFWRCPVSDGQCQDSLGSSSTSNPGISHRSARPKAPDTCGRKRQTTIGSSTVRPEGRCSMRMFVHTH